MIPVPVLLKLVAVPVCIYIFNYYTVINFIQPVYNTIGADFWHEYTDILPELTFSFSEFGAPPPPTTNKINGWIFNRFWKRLMMFCVAGAEMIFRSQKYRYR